MWNMTTMECIKCATVSTTNLFPITCIGYHEVGIFCVIVVTYRRFDANYGGGWRTAGDEKLLVIYVCKSFSFTYGVLYFVTLVLSDKSDS